MSDPYPYEDAPATAPFTVAPPTGPTAASFSLEQAAKRSAGLVPDPTNSTGDGAYNVKADTVIQAAAVDRGGQITTAGTSQPLAPANPNRRAFEIQNQSAGPLWVNELGEATMDFHSIQIPAGATYRFDPTRMPTGAINIIGATVGQSFYARDA